MKWAKSLILEENEKLEERLQTVLRYFSNDKDTRCKLLDLDATGKLGNYATETINRQKYIYVKISDVINIAEEDGQILELNLIVFGSNNYQIIIRDGQHLDIVGENELPPNIIGPNRDVDIDLYSSSGLL